MQNDKALKKEYNKLWYLRNRDKVINRSSIYYHKNKDKIADYHKQRYSTNTDKLKDYQVEYRKNNKNKIQNRTKVYYKKNIERITNNNKKYYIKNKEKILKSVIEYQTNHKNKVKIYNKRWNDKNPNYKKEYYKIHKTRIDTCKRIYTNNRYKTDMLYKCKTIIRALIGSSIRRMGYTKKSKTYSILGCTFIEFKQYIENQFKDGMTWLNYGEWELDHKIPMANADTEEIAIKLNHYTNFQPLWWRDNLAKSDKLIYA